jgi:membrane-bound serine protease (ClpP class)
MLFRESADPYVRISWSVLTTMVALSAVFFAAVISLAVRSQLRKPTTGREGMVGETGEAVTDIDPKGKVHVVGELWDARCDRPVRKGDRVVVKAVDGMTLVVEQREGPAEPPQEGGAPLPD